MKVKLVGYTRLAEGEKLIDGYTECDSIVMRAIAKCYRTQPSEKALMKCLENGHLSVFEHISFTFDISDVSRVLLAQLTRHRLASFTVESQRYTDYTKVESSCVIPHTIEKDGEESEALQVFWDAVVTCKAAYDELVQMGIPKEDARFVLPEAICTNLTFTANARELMHIIDLRTSRHAQWEIRELAYKMLIEVKKVAPLTFSKYTVNWEEARVKE